MLRVSTVAEAILSQSHHDTLTVKHVAAVVCLIWYVTVVLVCIIGYTQLWRHYSSAPASVETQESGKLPSVTIIRPVKGLEASIYDCLASTFRQVFPKDKVHVCLCISSLDDPAFPVLERLLHDFPSIDAQILVEEDDEQLQSGQLDLGPNPKIRNMSRAYREACTDVVWIIDCNVWVDKHTLGRMVMRLENDSRRRKNKIVHQMPLVVDTVGTTTREETEGLPNGHANNIDSGRMDGTRLRDDYRTFWNIGGGRLEELFMSSAHAKFYTAINTVLVAPCMIGKSTMFRRSHLDSLTDGKGIDFFSENICEDQLLGDLLWKQNVPEEQKGHKLGKHALCFGDLAIQPMSNMSVSEYWSRRVRWLRVRKFTVTLATLVEPGTESFVCSLYGAFAFTTIPFLRTVLSIPSTWSAFASVWLLSVSIWCVMDWTLYQKLQSAASIHVDADTPAFARPPKAGRRRPIGEWLIAWLGREALALPIWVWAFWGGTNVEWRGKRFWVGMDMKVHEIFDGQHDRGLRRQANSLVLEGAGKIRQD